MTIEDMTKLFATLLTPEPMPLSVPSKADWNAIESKFNCKFSQAYHDFIKLMSRYRFPGEIFNVATVNTNSNDLIGTVYDLEMSTGKWNQDMVPFYGVGNGDYFCLNARMCPTSPIYYYYADEDKFDAYCDSIETWIKQLPQFLA